MQPCSSISNSGVGLEPRAETRGHQQAETFLQPWWCWPRAESPAELRQFLIVTPAGRNLFDADPVPVFLIVFPRCDAALFQYFRGVEPRLETLRCNVPDVLDVLTEGELQQPGPRRSRYGRLLKPRKGLNDSC
ncbi:hypothetical protein TNCV_3950321 [Trichonephila clavipes]|nr:hypothetical protein TNCV_3950321 [Trichonephila clavipes]